MAAAQALLELLALLALLALVATAAAKKNRGQTSGERMHAARADPMKFRARANLAPPVTDIEVAPMFLGADAQSIVQQDIGAVTRDDGAVREVFVNGYEFPRETVKDAIFRNNNFATRDDFEFPARPNQQQEDASTAQPKSMFGPVKRVF